MKELSCFSSHDGFPLHLFLNAIKQREVHDTKRVPFRRVRGCIREGRSTPVHRDVPSGGQNTTTPSNNKGGELL
jgi:hypothetical protein